MSQCGIYRPTNMEGNDYDVIGRFQTKNDCSRFYEATYKLCGRCFNRRGKLFVQDIYEFISYLEGFYFLQADVAFALEKNEWDMYMIWGLYLALPNSYMNNRPLFYHIIRLHSINLGRQSFK